MANLCHTDREDEHFTVFKTHWKVWSNTFSNLLCIVETLSYLKGYKVFKNLQKERCYQNFYKKAGTEKDNGGNKKREYLFF